jgi:hypothetical protein
MAPGHSGIYRAGMLRGESDAVAGSVVRVWSLRREVVGAGFIAGPDTVATCYQVASLRSKSGWKRRM